MRPKQLLVVAGITGAVAAGGVLLVRPSSPNQRAASLQPTPRPAAATLDRSAKPMRMSKPGIAATARIVARERDPAGGPDWVLRTYQRVGQSGQGRVWCAQLGRLVDGAIAWVQPGSSRARLLPLGDAGTTSCAITAPISQRLGVNVGGFADGDPADPATRIRTAIAWGVVDRPVQRARLVGRSMAGPVKVVGNGFLVVRASDGAPSNITLRVRDTDGGLRAAIPLAAFDELPNPGPPPRPVPGSTASVEPRLNQGPPVDWGRRAPGNQFTVAAKLPADRIGIVSALYALQVPGQRPCVTDPVDTIGGRPISSWYNGAIGLVREPLLTCRFLPAKADRRPIPFGGGGSSGFDPDYSEVEAAQRRILNERRRPPATASLTVATPPGARFLEVRTPVGLTTVRVTDARVTVVQWDGQPEVNRALYPSYRSVNGKPGTRIGGQGVSFRALDAAGRQVGRTGSTRIP